MYFLGVLFISICAFANGSKPAIHSLTACEFNSIIIECAHGELIDVVSANYGRTDATTCSSIARKHTNCTAPDSLGIVRSMCQNKRECIVPARNRLFGDPCYGTLKYLKVEYACRKAQPCRKGQFRCNDGLCIPYSLFQNGISDCANGEDEIEANYRSEYACEGKPLNIRCRKGKYIQIVNANYGRLNTNICKRGNVHNTTCTTPQALNFVKNKCNHENTCSFEASNNVFGNPCYGISKYAEVHYTCESDSSVSEEDEPCVGPECINPDTRCDGKLDTPDGEDELQCDYITKWGCESETLKLQCPKKHVIKIVGANYGRQHEHICEHQTTVNCYAPGSRKTVEDLCEGKNSCNVQATSSEFGDPCVGTIKYLSVNYKCIDPSMENMPSEGVYFN